MSLHDRLLALVGIIPPFILLWLAEAYERRVLEPTQSYRYRVFAAAGLATIPIAWTERWLSSVAQHADLGGVAGGLFDAFVVAAMVEEVGKIACLWGLTRGRLAPRTRYGAFLYSLHATMGFALVENVLAMMKTPDMRALSDLFFLRAYFAVPTHLVATGTLGYLWARQRFDGGPIGLLGGLAIAIGIHGTFDALLFTLDHLSVGQDMLRVVCAAFSMTIPLVGVVALRWLSGRLRDDDRRDENTQGRAGASVQRDVAAT